MGNMRYRSVAALSALGIATLALAVQGVSLKWAPKENDQLKYKTVGDLTVGDTKATITAVNVHKVVRVDADGSYLVQATPVEGSATFGGTEYPMKGVTTLTTYNADGSIKEIRGDQANASGYRMANLTNFRASGKPVSTGDAWSVEGKADATTGAAAYKADFKVVGDEMVGTYDAVKVSVNARETAGEDAGKVTGFFWIGKDGVLAKSELQWSNITVPGAPKLTSGTLTMTRLE